MIKYSVNKSTVGDAGNYYALAQYTDKMNMNQFACHIADHGSVYSRADVLAVLTQMVDCMRELLLEGYRITLGDLGTFYTTLKSSTGDDPVTAATEFTASNIVAVKAKWSPGEEFQNMVDDASFEQVLTKEQQAAVLLAANTGATLTEENLTNMGLITNT